MKNVNLILGTLFGFLFREFFRQEGPGTVAHHRNPPAWCQQERKPQDPKSLGTGCVGKSPTHQRLSVDYPKAVGGETMSCPASTASAFSRGCSGGAGEWMARVELS